MDDTFLVFKSSTHVSLFLDYLNSKHRNIEFTSETESEGKLAFLDIEISHHDNSFSTSVYRKPTFTGLMTKFSSFIPICYKRNLVKTLTTRAFNICSNYFNLAKEFQFIKECLKHNGFTHNFTDLYIGKQLQKLLHPRAAVPSVNRAVVYFPMSFAGKTSFGLKNKLLKLMREFYPQIDVRVIFKPKFTLRNLFKFKDRIPSDLQSSLVYKYKCNCCNAMYYGKTKRQWKVRICEHTGRSVRTNRPLTKPPFSAIRDHAFDCDHPILKENFSVLTCKSNDMELTVAESLYTLRDKPNLCNNERSVELLCF